MSTKQELLRRLAQAGDTSLSGQELAGSLGVSRAAVHKAAAALRAEGWPICAQAGLGYRLAAGADLLSEQAVRALEGMEGSDFLIFLVRALELRNN